MGNAVASKLRALSVGNTGLEQCRPSHLAALGSKNYTGEVRPDCFGIILAVQGGCVGCSGTIWLFRDYFGCSGIDLAVLEMSWLVRDCLGCLRVVLAVQGLSRLFGD